MVNVKVAIMVPEMGECISQNISTSNMMTSDVERCVLIFLTHTLSQV